MAEYRATPSVSQQAAPPDEDPIRRFRTVFEKVHEMGLAEPTAMSVATADARGRPSVRTLLLKGVDERGFVFYTNLGSRKGAELSANPYAELCFFWQPVEVQVRIHGSVEQVSDEEADAYFASRPRGSQIGAWASRQSAPLASREELEARIREIEERYADRDVPRPPFWSGFRVLPERIEFWLGRLSRLHERDLYHHDPDAPGGWRREMLYP
jgi:pyridoxamine 5'-phosphate oxidase